MANLDRDTASAMVEPIVREKRSSVRAPVPGSLLKLELMKRAAATGTTFDEHAIGFRTFYDFVAQCPKVSVYRRVGSDFVVLPAGDSVQSVPASTKERIRRDLWFAFVSFPVPGTRRVYDRANDRVIYEEETKPVGLDPLITPFSQEQQLGWRVEFATKLGNEGQALKTALNSPYAFREFSIAVKRQPKWAREWNLFLMEKIQPLVEEWATKNGITKDRWLVSESTKVKGPPGRREIYALLDRLPLDRLMDLKVPLGWILEALQSEQVEKNPK
jgi:hypothetical protein